MFIYLDESGDLGFDFSKKKTTRKFVVTALVCFSQATERDFRKAKRRTLKNFLARSLMEKLPLSQTVANVRLIIDRSKNRDDIKDFNQYVENQLQAMLPLNTGLTIEHLTSHERAGLQAVDLFCWGIARTYEHDDLAWHDMFKHMLT